MGEQLREAARELVRLKDMKEWIESPVQDCSMSSAREREAAREEYESKKEPAWAALRQALSGQKEERWISVEERLPKPGAFVLCADSGGRVTQGQFCDLRHYTKPERCKKWDLYLFGKTDAVTHWMPLPAAPTTTATSGSKEEVKEQTEEELLTSRGGFKEEPRPAPKGRCPYCYANNPKWCHASIPGPNCILAEPTPEGAEGE